jgi:TRAP-type C4-dicarboxylate transport system permease small subunit
MASCSVRRFVLLGFETIAIAAFLIMLGASILQVVFRYVLDLPLMWTEELARLMCVFTTYFGGVVVLMLRDHIRVDLIDGLVGARGRIVAATASDVLVAWFLVVLAIGCWLMAQATWNTETATMSWFRMAYVYYGVGIAAIAMLGVVVGDIVRQLTALVRAAPREANATP